MHQKAPPYGGVFCYMKEDSGWIYFKHVRLVSINCLPTNIICCGQEGTDHRFYNLI